MTATETSVLIIMQARDNENLKKFVLIAFFIIFI